MSKRSGNPAADARVGARHILLQRVTVAALIVTMVAAALIPLLPSLIHGVITPDFTTLWTAGQFALQSPSSLYDVEATTAAQEWIRDPDRGPLPFVYPPTALFVLVPFGLLPFWTAFIVWTAAGAIAFWTAARRVTSGWVALLSLLSPPAMLVFILGQTTFLVGAAVLWSLALLRDRPVLAGALMGVAAAIKPQSAMLAPVAFFAGRNWTALIAAGCTWLLLALASLAFGPGLWLDWIRALPAFPDMIAEWNLDRHGATPFMMARFLGVAPAAFLMAGIVAGIAVVWVGSKSEDVKVRALSFVGGTLLASPYAMNYELTTMAPMLVAAMLTTTLAGLVIAIPLVAARVYAIVPTLLVTLVLVLRQSGDFKRRTRTARVAELDCEVSSRDRP